MLGRGRATAFSRPCFILSALAPRTESVPADSVRGLSVRVAALVSVVVARESKGVASSGHEYDVKQLEAQVALDPGCADYPALAEVLAGRYSVHLDRKIDAMMRKMGVTDLPESPPPEEDTAVREGDEAVETAKLARVLSMKP